MALTPYSKNGGSQGLRRFVEKSVKAGSERVYVDCVGDSLTFGQGANGTNSISTADNVADSIAGWVGQLRSALQAKRGGAAGEGFIFTNYSNEGRTVLGGTPGTTKKQTAPLGRNSRYVGATQTNTFTVPSGVTKLGIIQANQTAAFNTGGSGIADKSLNWSKNAESQGSVTTLTNTGIPLETKVSVTGGDVIVLSGPTTAQAYLSGLCCYSSEVGYVVNRIGVGGQVVGDVLGGQSEGTLSFAAESDQNAAIDVCGAWHTPGLLVLAFGGNDQSFQSGGGTSGQNKVTSTKFKEWTEIVTKRWVANGGCVLLIGETRLPAPGSPDSEAVYREKTKEIALALDHVTYVDMADVFGTWAEMFAAGQVYESSPHMKANGHALQGESIATLLSTAESEVLGGGGSQYALSHRNRIVNP